MSEWVCRQIFVRTIAIGLLILAAHACWILSDARFLDGTYFEYFIERDNWDVLTWNMYGVLMHPWAWLMWPFMGTENPGLAFRFVEWISLAVIGLSVLRMATRHARLDLGESMFLALAVALFPSYSAAMMSSTVIYIFPTALFYVGWAIYFDAALSAKNRPWMRLLPLPIWLLAFFHNSLLSFHFGFVALLFVLSIAHKSTPFEGAGGIARFLLAFLRKHALAAALPFLFFALRALSFPADSPFGAHNGLIFDPARNIRAFLGGFHHHVSMNLSSAFLGQEWLLGLVLVGLGGWLAFGRRKPNELRTTLWIAALGAMFAVLAILPYAAVAKAAPLQSFGARYGILSALGGSLVLLAIWRSLPFAKRWRAVLGALFLAGLALRGISDDLMWLGRWAKDRAAMQHLAALPSPRPGTILLWDDNDRVGNETYRPFELSWFFLKAWGSESWIGVDLRERTLQDALQDATTTRLKHTNIAANFEMNGCSQTVSVRAAEVSASPRRMGFDYLTGYVLSTPAEMAVFLAPLVQLGISQPECERIPTILSALRAAEAAN
ncbi:membrane hypothetical protein [Rhodospirillaceae bacterium LM-1]|nr:membrane hypothetical protein [Rhodospirillaceae bacterium LM-1]